MLTKCMAREHVTDYTKLYSDQKNMQRDIDGSQVPAGPLSPAPPGPMGAAMEENSAAGSLQNFVPSPMPVEVPVSANSPIPGAMPNERFGMFPGYGGYVAAPHYIEMFFWENICL